MQDFEGSFSTFIDGTEYDKAEDAIFALVRTTFQAGWLAAGGELQKLQDVTDKTPSAQ